MGTRMVMRLRRRPSRLESRWPETSVEPRASKQKIKAAARRPFCFTDPSQRVGELHDRDPYSFGAARGPGAADRDLQLLRCEYSSDVRRRAVHGRAAGKLVRAVWRGGTTSPAGRW